MDKQDSDKKEDNYFQVKARVDLDTKEFREKYPTFRPINDMKSIWEGSLKGVNLYYGGVYKVQIEIPKDYPFKAPKVKWLTPIWHPNISSHSIKPEESIYTVDSGFFYAHWRPLNTIVDFVRILKNMLYDPAIKVFSLDPHNAEAANQVMNKIDEFEEKAMNWVENFAQGDSSATGKKIEFDIVNLLKNESNLIFLVGAGCSVDTPSCLTTGNQMIEAIIKHTCPESEIETILRLNDLRFELVVEMIRNNVDKNLRIIDFYGLCDRPNIQHYFLADMIHKEHVVLTTNFDYLLEYALIQSNVPKKSILPVITQSDYEHFSDPDKLHKQGKKPVYKIHGSTKNIITQEDTRKSLIATIQAFGKNKEGLNVFQIEPFKRTLFENLSDGRSLVVIGYSGSDDFDIVPTLKKLKNLKNFIWIDYTEENKKAEIYEIQEKPNQNPYRLSPEDEILLEMKLRNQELHVLKVKVNTSEFINNLVDKKHKIDENNFSVKIIDWLQEKVVIPNEMYKYNIALQIYSILEKFDNAMDSARKLLNLAIRLSDSYWRGIALINLGEINKIKKKYTSALKFYREAIEFINSDNMKMLILSNIGLLYHHIGELVKAKEFGEKTLKIFNIEEDFSEKFDVLVNLGIIFKSSDYFDKALHIAQEKGDLKAKAISLYHLGKAHFNELKHSLNRFSFEAEDFLEALRILEELGLENSELAQKIYNKIGYLH
jgi:ubiquitin-protein ligase/tetratricopeptide (TPR) repeat protein